MTPRCEFPLGCGLSCARTVGHRGPHRSGDRHAEQRRLAKRRARARQRGMNVPPGAWINAAGPGYNFSAVPPDDVSAMLSAIDTNRDWMEAATCVSTDPELFFPDKGRSDMAHAARRICAACPVRQQCLDHALAIGETGENSGIWGGMTYRERRAEASRRQADAAPAKEHAA